MAVLVMMEGVGSPVSSVSVGMARASGTAMGRTAERGSAGLLPGESRGAASPAPVA